jgi:capsular exopolysaccharide synthesis family protein
VFGGARQDGMSAALSGLSSDPLGLVVPTGIERLDLLPSGPIPPNPSELLNSTTFSELAETFLAAGYDHVVYDSPPVLSVADAVILTNAVDSCVLVVRAARTPRPSLRVAVDKLRQVGGVPIGLVLNDLDPAGRAGASYGYYRAYGRDANPPGEAARSATGV